MCKDHLQELAEEYELSRDTVSKIDALVCAHYITHDAPDDIDDALIAGCCIMDCGGTLEDVRDYIHSLPAAYHS